MRIPVRDIPQADRLEDVVEVVAAVHRGERTYQAMAKAIDKGERQGRYYRLAAEILGFIRLRSMNTAQLTSEGKSLLLAAEDKKKELLVRAVLRSRLFQRIIPFLESALPSGCTRTELETFVKAVTSESGETMIHRRVSTTIAWLEEIDLLSEKNGRFILRPLPACAPIIDYAMDIEPLLPTKFDLREYTDAAQRITNAKRFIVSAVRQAQRERANNSHIALTNLVALKIRQAGAIPRRNRHIDLAAHINQNMFIFEMKSTIEGNAHTQIRSGISQLYEYRYLQATPNADLVLVIEKPLKQELQWLGDYLLRDRGIFLVWDNDGDRLHCPDAIRDKLHFLL